MADYKEMYRRLFISVTKSIELLQNAQREAEELYIETSTDGPVVLNWDNENEPPQE